MPTSSSRLAYPDCEEFFNKALEDGRGVRLPFQIEGHARQFLVRCNSFRQICRQDNMRIHAKDHPMYGRCEYDTVALSVVPTEDHSDWFVYARIYKLNESDVESLSEIEGQP